MTCRQATPPCLLIIPQGLNTLASTETLSVQLSQQQTRALLQEVPEAFHTQITSVSGARARL